MAQSLTTLTWEEWALLSSSYCVLTTSPAVTNNRSLDTTMQPNGDRFNTGFWFNISKLPKPVRWRDLCPASGLDCDLNKQVGFKSQPYMAVTAEEAHMRHDYGASLTRPQRLTRVTLGGYTSPQSRQWGYSMIIKYTSISSVINQ